MWPWASYLTSLSLGFLIGNMGLILIIQLLFLCLLAQHKQSEFRIVTVIGTQRIRIVSFCYWFYAYLKVPSALARVRSMSGKQMKSLMYFPSPLLLNFCFTCKVPLIPDKFFTSSLLKNVIEPRLVWLRGLSAWVVGQVPSWGRVRGNWSRFLSHIDVSLPFSFPSPLSKNK